jgi:hypothetical protein
VKFIPTVAAVLFLVLGFCERPSNAQVDDTRGVASGGGSIVATNTTPKLGQIGANYFEPLKQSQIWINAEPELMEAGPAPVLLNLTIAFPGVRLSHQPTTVAVRAQPRCFPQVFPEHVRQPILRFLVNASTTIDLTAPGAAYQLVPSCSESQPDTVIAEVPFTLLRQIAEGMNVTVDALGFALRFTTNDGAAWRLFVHTVENGTTVVQPR